MTDKVNFVFVAPATPESPRIVTWPCTFSEPQDGGTRIDKSINVKFKVLSQEQIMAAFRGGDSGLYDQAVVGFAGLKTDAGQDVADADAVPALRGVPYVVAGILAGYSDMMGNRQSKN